MMQRTQNVKSSSHQTKTSEKQKAMGQSPPSGHQGVHQSGVLIKDNALKNGDKLTNIHRGDLSEAEVQ